MMNRFFEKGGRNQLSVARKRMLTPEKKGLSGVSIASEFSDCFL